MPIEVIMPKVDMDMTTGTIAGWAVDEGQSTEKGETLFEIETDKATMEVESPASGTLHFVTAQSGDVVDIGKCVAWIFEEGEAVENPNPDSDGGSDSETQPITQQKIAPAQDDTPQPKMSPNSMVNSANGTVRATPLARRTAKLKGIDIASIQGTGPHGRVCKSDVDNSSGAQSMLSTTHSSSGAVGGGASKSQLDDLGIAYDTVPVGRMRQTIAARLTESKTKIPHFYLETDCQLDALLALRAQTNEALSAMGGPKISINDMLVRACAQALKTVPEANASWVSNEEGGDEIIRYQDANISVAVSIEGGLITPVVRQAQNKSLNKISEEITDLAERAKSGKLKPHEYQGGSFSISNLGMFGVKSFSAIINPPESMILAVGKAERRFVEDENGNPVGATILSVTLSCDHRVVDGALGARWLAEFKRFVETPVLLGMDLD